MSGASSRRRVHGRSLMPTTNRSSVKYRRKCLVLFKTRESGTVDGKSRNSSLAPNWRSAVLCCPLTPRPLVSCGTSFAGLRQVFEKNKGRGSRTERRRGRRKDNGRVKKSRRQAKERSRKSQVECSSAGEPLNLASCGPW